VTNLIGLPTVRNRWPLSVQTHHLSHFFNGWVRLDHVIEWKLVIIIDTTNITPPCNLPKYETKSINICPFKRIKVVDVDKILKHLHNKMKLRRGACTPEYTPRIFCYGIGQQKIMRLCMLLQ